MEKVNLSNIEEKVFAFWQNNHIFQKVLTQSESKKRFNFYDGPPFATGSPHYGHLLAGTVKDVICRFQTINGKYVPRINGWDTHGLPAEQLVEKMLGIKTKDQIEELGIAKFNKICKEKVLESTGSWEKVIPRLGRWIDFKNGYQTMDFEFMNAVWAVFKVIYEKGYVYHSLVPMPFSTGCGSCLSHFEAKSNYQNTTDPSIVALFPLIEPLAEQGEINLLVWTTTPYSLSANLALCINRKIKYMLVKITFEDQTEKLVIASENGLKSWKLKNVNSEILREISANELIGIKYSPPYDFFEANWSSKIFTVLEDSYVKDECGTGIVHLAPGLGEDDYRICLREGIINPHKPSTILSPIDDQGKLTIPNSEFDGKYVKGADKIIIKNLRSRKLLWDAKNVEHSYPFCYRTDTPLIQKAVPSWFIDVHPISQRMVELNSKINWVDKMVGEHRFHQWLKEPHDWAFGRNRYWGTPVPLWVSESGDEIVCIGSVKELEELAGLKEGEIKDLHRHHIDHLVIPSKLHPGQVLKRIDDVFDCWFESGSMPYGKFAVENGFRQDQIYQLLSGNDIGLLDKFMETFPADFIGEGLDQTRGWFYTLLVLSTFLFDLPAYQNVIVNGLILTKSTTRDKGWDKMSKRHKNYPDPQVALDQYGADSLRLYLLDSPVVKSESLKFDEAGLEQKGKFLVQWYHCFQFLEQELKLILDDREVGKFELVESKQIYDQWILGELHQCILRVTRSYNEYKLYQAVPFLIKFEDLFSKWYLNLSKLGMKGSNGLIARLESVSTFAIVLKYYSILISPITPFMSDYIYRELGKLLSDPGLESVHMELLEKCQLNYNQQISQQVAKMVEVIISVRSMKTSQGIGLRQKSKLLTIQHLDQSVLDSLEELESELRTVIKVDKIIYRKLCVTKGGDFEIQFSKGLIGKIAKRDSSKLMVELDKMTVQDFLGKTTIEILGYTLPSDTWTISPVGLTSPDSVIVQYTQSGFLITLDKEIVTTKIENDVELLIKKIQIAKKELKLKAYNRVKIYLCLSQEPLHIFVFECLNDIISRLRSDLCLVDKLPQKEWLGTWTGDNYQFGISN